MHGVARDLNVAQFASYVEVVKAKVVELKSGAEPHERLGAIMAMDQIVDASMEGSEPQLRSIAHHLNDLLPGNDVVAVDLTVRVLGKLALQGGSVATSVIDQQIPKIRPWLDGATSFLLSDSVM